MSDSHNNNRFTGRKTDATNTNSRSSRSNYKQTNKKRLSKKKVLLFIGIPIVLLLTAGIAYAAHLYTNAQKTAEESYENVDRDKGSNLRDSAVDPVEDNVSILILGIDEGDERSEDGDFRTDSMMLATFNKDEGDVKLLTIPRDSYAYIPEVDRYTKINHAHSYGGVTATIDAVEDFLHVPVDYYARVNFNAFIETIDALGGIYYDVPYEIEESDENDKKGAIHINEGYQKLDGKHALALARTRKYDSDVERGQRQQEIIKTIADDVASASSLLKLDDIMDAVGSNLTTNLTFDHMKSFMSYGMNNDFSIDSVELEGEGGYQNDGLWYYMADSRARMETSNILRYHLDLPEARLSAFQADGDNMGESGIDGDYADQEPDNQHDEQYPQSPRQNEQQTTPPQAPEQPQSPDHDQHSASDDEQTPPDSSDAPTESKAEQETNTPTPSSQNQSSEANEESETYQ